MLGPDKIAERTFRSARVLVRLVFPDGDVDDWLFRLLPEDEDARRFQHTRAMGENDREAGRVRLRGVGGQASRPASIAVRAGARAGR